MLVIGYELEYFDVEHKFVDDTKTTVFLNAIMLDGTKIRCGYVHSPEKIEECKRSENIYLDLIFNAIRKSL